MTSTTTNDTGAHRSELVDVRATSVPNATLAVPDQTAKARGLVSLLLALDPAAMQTTLARVIAASIHDGPGTALERFAATGDIDDAAILEELDRVTVPFEQEAWIDALASYVMFAGGRP